LITYEYNVNLIFIVGNHFDGKITFSLHTPKFCVLLTLCYLSSLKQKWAMQ
jgi:hypothetical protein